ncbi:MAG: energy transducer TonB [Edaphobacter sp.]
MSFFSNTQDTAGRYGKYMAEFQELFRKSGAGFGSPEDFYRLGPKLAYDDSFRAEFVALTRSVAKREEGRLSLSQMLTIVAVSMGGMEIDRVGSAGAVPISLLVVFLSGLGGWSERESALVGTGESEEGSGESMSVQGNGECGREGGEVDEEREAKELEHRLTAGAGNNLEGVAAALFSGSSLMKEALSRLELNMLQLKVHLDSIDGRMERIEPHLDDLTWRFGGQNPGVQNEAAAKGRGEVKTERPEELESLAAMKRRWVKGPAVEPVSELVTGLGSGLTSGLASGLSAGGASEEVAESALEPGVVRGPEAVLAQEPELVLMPVAERGTVAKWAVEPSQVVEPPVVEPPVVEPEPLLNRSVRVPFERYVREEEEEEEEPGSGRGRRVLVVLGVLVVMAAAAAGAFVYRYGRPGVDYELQRGRAVMSVVMEKGRAAIVRGKEIWWKPAPTGSGASEEKPTGDGGDGTSGVAPAAGDAPAASDVAAPSVPSAAVGSTGSAGSGQVEANAARRELRPAAGVGGGSQVARASVPGSPMIVSPRESSGGAAVAFVNAAQLSIVSKVEPVYPHDAKAQGITGEVVVQAIISPAGSVESVQIVSGPAGLLKASLDAMKGWRYKPYLVDGKPTAVRTFVKFRFSREE